MPPQAASVPIDTPMISASHQEMVGSLVRSGQLALHRPTNNRNVVSNVGRGMRFASGFPWAPSHGAATLPQMDPFEVFPVSEQVAESVVALKVRFTL